MTQQQVQMIHLLKNQSEELTNQIYLAAQAIIDTAPDEATRPVAGMSSSPSYQ